MTSDFFVFIVVGFCAQIVDGALGMAFGVLSTTSLLAFGVPAANASAM
ncbi:sulfite exporter TauE/SafE family protein, partial [Rhizobium ruizarguesonis]